MQYICGVDLGQSVDFAAIVVVKRVPHVTRDVRRMGLQIQQLKRFRLGTKYSVVTDFIDEALQKHPLHHNTQLVVDVTGVGIPVYEQMKAKGLKPLGIFITGGTARVPKIKLYGASIPKRDLVSAGQVLLQDKRITATNTVKRTSEGARLIEEMVRFVMKHTTAGNQQFEGDRTHDDLVMSLLYCCWMSLRGQLPYSAPPTRMALYPPKVNASENIGFKTLPDGSLLMLGGPS